MSRRFRCPGAGTARPAGSLSRRGQTARGRTRPKSFHARRSAETGVYSRFSFINQASSFHAAPLFIDEVPTHSHGGFTPPFSRLIDALVRRDRNRGICPYTGNGRVGITAQFRRAAKKNFQTEVATCTFASQVATLANGRKIFALPGKIFRSCDFRTIGRRWRRLVRERARSGKPEEASSFFVVVFTLPHSEEKPLCADCAPSVETRRTWYYFDLKEINRWSPTDG